VHKAKAAGLVSKSQSAFLFSIMLLAMFGLAFVFYQYYSEVFEAGSAQQVVEQRAFQAPENSIAVLPFTDMSVEGDQAYFSDGISEEILNLLAGVSGLHVAARTSSFAFRDTKVNIREIGRLLKVRTLLEGSVRKIGNRVRLTAQLINIEDGYHIWSQTYDREITDIFAIQDEVSIQIATALVESFTGLTTKPVGRTDSFAASQAYRTGRIHWWRRTPGELQRAIELFATALEHDARFAPAYAAMADTWLLLSLYGNVNTLKATRKAEPMIVKALEIDPGSGEAFAALGLARWQIGQMDAAESALRQAIKLNENYVPAQLWLAGLLGELGRYPEEHQVLENAMIIDPLNELLAVNFANNLTVRGDWAEGKELMQGLMELRPDSTMLLRKMAAFELEHGNLVEGWNLANRAWQLRPDDPEDISALARTWLLLGEVEKAESIIRQGLESFGQNRNLLSAYWLTLMVLHRFEEAEALVRDVMSDYGDSLPDALQRDFDFRLGILAFVREDFSRAYSLFNSAIGDEDGGVYKGEKVWVITMASLASAMVGKHEEAESRLVDAERQVQRARLNGVDDPDIYYTEAVILAMRDQSEQALEKLNQAYQRGFRELWALNMDGRLDSLREQPGFIDLQNRMTDDISRALTEIKSVSLALY
jgi:TolB-like protein/Flp pilus assembly protein TadD